jgi:DNA-binding NtrC family response regulator
LFARAVHNLSDRADKPFIQINCAALPEGLIESALFGHERGAFTGAVKRVEGAFERAHRGTLLLDEISEMRLDLQAKLLRVLQEQEFERVGGTTPIRVDVRVIATTNRDLARESEAGTFRRDLYFRLGVIPLLIPPLRDRREDIPLLAHRFAEKTASEMRKEIRGFSADAMSFLQSQDWPGNVRELQHAVERAVIFTTDSIVQVHAFDSVRFGLAPGGGSPTPARAMTPIKAAVALSPSNEGTGDGALMSVGTLNVADVEKALIAKALEMTGGHRTQAAGLLGISVRTLRNKLNIPEDQTD